MTVLTPIVNAPNLYVNGLDLAQGNTTTWRVSPGIARDSTNTNDLALGDSTLINIAVNGLNGLDTGTVAASTLYAIYIIGDSSNYHPTGCIMSLSITAPVLPFGYDMFRRIGWGRTNGSSLTTTIFQTGRGMYRTYTLYAPVNVLTNGAATTSTAVSLLNSAPPANGGGLAIFEVVYTPASATNIATFGAQNSSSTIQRFGTGVAGAQYGQVTVPYFGSPTPQFFYKVTNGSDTLTVNLVGYADEL